MHKSINKTHFLFSLMVLLIISSCNSANNDEQKEQKMTLKDAFKDKFFIGTALNAHQISGKDTISLKVLKEHFNSIVAENCMKSERIHPEEGQFNFELPDKFVELGEKNNMQIIGHTLIWHSQAAPWFFVDEDGKDVSKEVLIERMKTHISTIVGRYKGRIHGWDVVNEAINDDGTWRETKFYQIIGEDYVRLAFEFAQAADPDAELYYNDYSMANPGRRNGVIAMVKDLQSKGVKIDGIGMQGHLTMTYPEVEDFEKSLSEFSKLGLKIMITEVDLTVIPWPGEKVSADVALSEEYRAEYNPYPNGLPDSVAQVWTNRYKSFFSLFNKYEKNISRVTMWGITDGQSWRDNWPIKGRTDYPLLFDREFKPKKVVWEIIEDLKGD